MSNSVCRCILGGFCMEVVQTVSNSVCRCILGDFVWRWCRLCPIQFVGVYWGILYGGGVDCVQFSV